MHLSPYIRFACDHHIDYPWLLKERIIYDYELLYLKEGQLVITIEDDVYNTNPGDIFLFRPNRRHSMRVVSNNGFRQPHIHFDLIYEENSPLVPISMKNYQDMTEKEQQMIRTDIVPEFGVNLPDKLAISDMDTFERLLFDVIDEYENQMTFSSIDAQGAFLRLWSFILRQHLWHATPSAAFNSSLMMEIRHYLNTNTNRAITLEELAKQYNLNKYHLAHIFKDTFGVSPIQYHQFCRLEKAKNLVLYSSLSMTQIADMLGFSCLSAFTRAFKKQHHAYPSFYRNNSSQNFE